MKRYRNLKDNSGNNFSCEINYLSQEKDRQKRKSERNISVLSRNGQSINLFSNKVQSYRESPPKSPAGQIKHSGSPIKSNGFTMYTNFKTDQMTPVLTTRM
jgi:hypothetical protein